MSDKPAPAPRPVSTVAVAAIFFLLSLYGLIALRIDSHSWSPAPQNEAPDNLSKDLAWKATPATRRDYLADLRRKQGDQAAAYGWVDQKAGVVQLPLDRAMELVVKQYGASP